VGVSPTLRTSVGDSRITENLLNVIAAKTGELNTAAARSAPEVTPTLTLPLSGGGDLPPALHDMRLPCPRGEGLHRPFRERFNRKQSP
jgi:hypothetical protein